MSEEEKGCLKAQIEIIYDRYKSLFISGVMWEDIAQKERDAVTNAINRKYVDGTF